MRQLMRLQGIVLMATASLFWLGCEKSHKNRLLGGDVSTAGGTATSGIAKALASLSQQSSIGNTTMGAGGSAGGGSPAFRSPGLGRAPVQGCSSPFSNASAAGSNSAFTGTPFYNVPNMPGGPGGRGSDFIPQIAGSASNSAGTRTIDMFDASIFCDSSLGMPSLLDTTPGASSNVTMRMEFKGGGSSLDGSQNTMAGQMAVSQSFVMGTQQGQEPTVTMSITQMAFGGTTTTPNGKTITMSFSADVPITMNLTESRQDKDMPGTVTVTIQPDNLVITGRHAASGVFTGTVTQGGATVGTVVVDANGNGTFTSNSGAVSTFTVGF